MDMTKVLPADCIPNIISLTSPKDACRSSSVSSVLKEAEDSDDVWERFLPPDYEDTIAQSSSPSLASSLTKRQIFFHLCDHPVLLNNGEMIRQATKLYYVWWLEIKGRVMANLLSPGTAYAAFFVYKLETDHSLVDRYVEISVNNEESATMSQIRAILDPSTSTHSKEKRKRTVQQREDGWMEVEMGEFFNEDGHGGFVECKVWETNGYIKDGLIVEGIEFRPQRSE